VATLYVTDKMDEKRIQERGRKGVEEQKNGVREM
jgi:hypothetical protein